MTTPDLELSKIPRWKDEFAKAFPKPEADKSLLSNSHRRRMWLGYRQAKIEGEQIMKLAKFGAMVMDSKILMCHDYGTIDRAIEADLLSDNDKDGLVLRNIEYIDGIEATIKELLK